MLAVLSEALDMELREPQHVARALQRWRGLLVLDDCDAARHSGGLLDILTKLTSTQELSK